MSEDPLRTHQYYYQVGAHQLLMEPDLQAEVLLSTQTADIPFSPRWSKGLISLRGELVPLIDLHYILYGHPEPKDVQADIHLWLKPKDSPAIIVKCNHYPKNIQLTSLHSDNTPDTVTHESPLPKWISGTHQEDAQTFLIANHTILVRSLMHATKNH